MAKFQYEKLIEQSDHFEESSDAKGHYGSVKSSDICIMVAGKPGNGKSTALNNIFGLDLRTDIGFKSVTTKIHQRKVKKNNVNLVVLDTPGLGAVDIDKEVITMAMAEALNCMDYTLLYCLSVGPGSRLTETDIAIIENLQATLGPQVWDKCVVLLTFSDMTRRESFPSAQQDADYKQYLKGVADDFSEIVCRGSAKGPVVKSILEFTPTHDIYSRVDTTNDIIAIPIGKIIPSNDKLNKSQSERSNMTSILPGILSPTDDWTDLVFVEIMRKTEATRRKSFVLFKYGAAVAGSVTGFVAAGAALGGAAGAAAGGVLGPAGSLVAGGIGAAAGAGLGAVVGMTITSIVAVLKSRKKYSAVHQLLENK